MKNTFFISLGGSLIVPSSGIDFKFLKKFRELILAEVKKGKKFYIISGGGSTCRQYQNAAAKIVKIKNEDKDWLGIHSTRLNAHLLRTIFRGVAHPEIIKNPTLDMAGNEKVFIAGGWKPGWSTDYVATMLAKRNGIEVIINLSNIDYAYSKDPKKYTDAKPIKKIDWKGFRKIVGNKWDPGLNLPFDPVASKLAHESGLEVVIMNGKKISNLKNYLAGKKFTGTIIS